MKKCLSSWVVSPRSSYNYLDYGSYLLLLSIDLLTPLWSLKLPIADTMAPTKATLTRQLGPDGPKIPAVGFGLMGFSVGYGPAEYVYTHKLPS